MISFRERNPFAIGALGLATCGALFLAAFNVEDLPLVGSGDTYEAAFTEAAGLRPTNEVRVAGVKVGSVENVELDGDHVLVSFTVRDGVEFGTRTGASIRIKTVLGQKYLALEPRGPGQLSSDTMIPTTRTLSPYDVTEAFSQLTKTTEKIHTGQLAEAMDTMAETFEDTPEEVQASIRGLSRLSHTIAERDEKLRRLVDHAEGVTKVLRDRNEQFVKLLEDSDLLLKEIQARREVIHQILVNTSYLATQLTALVQENRREIGPALDRLHSVLTVLQQNQDNLERSVALLGPFVRMFANVLGTGRWFDTYIQNLVPLPTSVQRP
ncbi:MAG: MCE family protein [Streptomycetales bacterium]